MFSLIFFFSCRQDPERNLNNAKELIRTKGIVNLCLQKGSYVADTLRLTPWNSLDKNVCPSLIFKNNNKLNSCKPDFIFGLDEKSSWVINPNTGILTLNIIYYGIDDEDHFNADYQIEKFVRDTIIIVKIKPEK